MRRGWLAGTPSMGTADDGRRTIGYDKGSEIVWGGLGGWGVTDDAAG